MANSNISSKIINIVKTTAEWAKITDVITKGVLCVETTTDNKVKIKIGNGTDTFINLPYASETALFNYFTKAEVNSLVESSISQETTARDEADTVLNNRIDNIISGVTIDTEVIDSRQSKDKLFATLKSRLDSMDITHSDDISNLSDSIPMRVTFGEPVVLVPETTLEFHKDGENDWYVTDENPLETFTLASFAYNILYKVIFDGVEYELLCFELFKRIEGVGSRPFKAIGSTDKLGADDLNITQTPFCISCGYWKQSKEIQVFSFDTLSTHTFKIIGIPFDVKVVNERFYTNNIAPLIRKGKQGHSFCIGAGCKATNDFAISMGCCCEADGEASFAFGHGTKAKGRYSVSGGNVTIANGNYSIAFGYKHPATQVYTQANGITSLAIGIGCVADGNASRAIGQAVNTKGALSTGVGNELTVNGRLHFAIGKYNLVEEGDLYAFSVGNGASEEARSNAYTLDWEGNGCYQGKVESKSGVLKLGDTEVTEEQLKSLLALLTTI